MIERFSSIFFINYYFLSYGVKNVTLKFLTWMIIQSSLNLNLNVAQVGVLINHQYCGNIMLHNFSRIRYNRKLIIERVMFWISSKKKMFWINSDNIIFVARKFCSFYVLLVLNLLIKTYIFCIYLVSMIDP